jgi:hypothetical protein
VTLLLTPLTAAPAADIAWSGGVVTGDAVVSNRGTLVEACNFGNVDVSAPTVNGVPFTAVDFTSGQSPASLSGLTYNTGESGKLPGSGVNELSDAIAYRSGVDPQVATLTGLSIGTDYELQFFYYHNSVNRSVTIRDGNGNEITLREEGEPMFATGSFTADATTQDLTFDANTGSQFLNAYQLREATPVPPLVLGEVIISEFSASNDSGHADGDGSFPDWIEIWNSTEAVVLLDGWFLTDDAAIPGRWPFPYVTLEPNEFLVVHASGQAVDDYVDAGGALHANFRLDAAGGYLALMKPDGAGGIEVASEFWTYPPQETDISYGFYGTAAPLAAGFLESLTPGAPNSAQGFGGFVADTKFTPNRGFYSAPIDVVITTATEGAVIRYTTDGSEPGIDHGLDYPGGAGIPVTGTTIIRAAAFRDGFQPTDIDTHTYLFVDDVVNQPANPRGFPVTWTGSDYAMEDNATHLALIAGDGGLSAAEAKAVVADALLELPALSLSMHVDDWFSPSLGIYHNSTAGGMAWERACSAELIHPPGLAGEGDFQVDCGVRIQGFTSRNPSANPKHSLRLAFRGRYGETKLRHPFFGDEGPSEFDTIVLRSNAQDAWVYSSGSNRVGQFIRDEWARKTHRAMGHASPTSNWVHLFINGLYWGVYNPTERPDAAHSAAYFGGDKDNYDALKNHEEVLDGTGDAYRVLLAMIQNDPNNFSAGYRDLSDPADYAAVIPFFDLEMMIDYMIHNMYAAATDWPGNNYIGYDRTGAHGGWKFYDWDNEHGMKHPVNTNRTTPHSRDRDSPTKFHHALRSNAEYRVLFGDRLHKAMFNGGALHVDPADPAWDPAHPGRNIPAARWMELTGRIETALIAESARWGDYRKSTPYTMFNEFQSIRNDLLQNWFPTRSSIVLSQFRAQGLYPQTDAPEFSRFGGVVPAGFRLRMTAPGGGTIYFTRDGSDPRIPATAGSSGDGLSANAEPYTSPVTLDSTGTVKARVLDGGEWSALTETSFIVGTPADAGNLVVSEIMYHPVGGTPHEYIEVMNISTTETVELTGVRFTAGISFEFPVGMRLVSGERLLVVDNLSAFEAAYGAGHPVAGPYTGQLDNGGEQLVLTAQDGAVIRDFRYGDDSPWPESADGAGDSLVLVAPAWNPDHSDPFSWRASVGPGGTPGTADDTQFEGSPNEDFDADGLVALIEYALGSSDTLREADDFPSIATGQFPDGAGGMQEYPTFTYRRNLAADDLVYQVEISADNETWSSAVEDVVFVSSRNVGGGVALVTYRSTSPIGARPHEFMRLRVTTR